MGKDDTLRSYRHRFEGPAYRALLIAGARGLPPWAHRLTMPGWAGLFFALLPGWRQTARRNLTRLFGVADPLRSTWRAYRLFRNYSQAITNAYVMHTGGRLPVRAQRQGESHLTSALAAGRGVIVATGHLGNWQLGPYLLSRPDLPPLTVAMAEEPNRALSRFERRVSHPRFEIVFTTSDPYSSMILARKLRHGELVALQMDRHNGGQTLRLPFYGGEVDFGLGPVALARATGAPIVPAFILQQPAGRSLVCVEPPIEVARTADRDADLGAGLRALVAVYERYVRAHPYQWYNFFDFWSSAGDGR